MIFGNSKVVKKRYEWEKLSEVSDNSSPGRPHEFELVVELSSKSTRIFSLFARIPSLSSD